MGGERYRFIRLRDWQRQASQQAGPNLPTQDQIEAYAKLVPTIRALITECYQEDQDEWSLAEDEKAIKLCYLKNDPTKWPNMTYTVELPLRFQDWSWRQQLGWQDRGYGSVVDPRKDLTNKIMDMMMGDKVLQHVFQWEEEDCVMEDLGCYDDYSDGEHEQFDFTACDKECGYCGHCDYE